MSKDAFRSGHRVGDHRIRASQVHHRGAGTVEVEAIAESIFPIHTLEIVQEGRVVASAVEAKGVRRLHLKDKIKVERHSWLAARCGGPNYERVPHHDVWAQGGLSHKRPFHKAAQAIHRRMHELGIAL